MSWSTPDVSLLGIGPQRLSAPHLAMAIAAADAAAIILSGLACRGLNTLGHAGHTPREILVVLAMAGLTLLMLRKRGLYGQPLNGGPYRPVALVLAVAHAFALLLLALLFWEQASHLCLVAGWHSISPQADGILATNRYWLFTWVLSAPLLLLLLRGPLEATLANTETPPARRRAVVIGDAVCTARLARQLRNGQGLGEAVEILGCFSRAARGARPSLAAEAGWPALPSLAAARALIARGEADLLLIALPERAGRTIAAIRRAMAGLALDIWLAPESEWLCEGGARLSSLGGLPFLHVQERPMADTAAFLKRAEDLLVGAVLLTLAAPVMLAIALAVRLSSPGGVFFIQPRLGLNGRIIHVRKFRTMRAEAADPSGRHQARPGDCRVTAVGHFLRRTSLDELPQLFNVLGGSMSLVGPRPHALGTEAGGLPFGEAAAGYAARHRVKPGITGWAQVSGLRGETRTVEKLRARVAHDLFYIAQWSLLFDLRILALTLRAVVRGDEV